MSTYRPAGAAPPAAPQPALPALPFAGPGALLGFEVRGSTLVLDVGGPRLAVTFLAEDVARVRYAPDGDFRRSGHGADAQDSPFSYALDLTRSWDPVPITVEEEGEGLRVRTTAMTLRVSKAPCRLAFETPDGRPFLQDADGPASAPREGGASDLVRASFQLPPEARFFGLGDKAFPLERSGRRYTFWNADTYAYAPAQDPIYKSIPFLLGLHPDGAGSWVGYGLFFDNTFRSTLDLGAGAGGGFTFESEGGELRYYVFAGPHTGGPDLKTPLRRYCDLTGHKPMPARWSLGYHQSRWNYHDDGYARWVAHEFRRRGLPLECIHLDIGHMDGFRVFTWHPEAFRDPRALNDDLRTLGVRSVVIVDPGVKVDAGYFAYREGVERGLFCTNPDGSFFTDTVWPGDVHWPDFSQPEARAWWGAFHRHYLDAGVSGIWNDMNEPAILGGRDFPDEVQFAFADRGTGPTNHREAHNVYGLLMARATYEGLRALKPNERPFLLTRACFSGSQRYAAAWTGDNVSTWEHLLLSLQICQSLSASGLAFCGPDIGGFAGRPSPELYARWMQAGVFFPFMRTHYSHEEIAEQEPWSFGDEVEAICRRYLALRYELLPYLYTAFVDCCATGVPPMKALFLEHPEDPRVHAADDQFYAGPSLLAAPVVEEGARSRAVFFPDVPGGWFDFGTGERVAGGGVRTVPAPLDALPLFAKAGQVVPLHPLMLHTEEFVPDVLVLRVYPGTGESSVYFDDGISFAHEQGDFLRLSVRMVMEYGLWLQVDRDGRYALPYRTFEWQVVRPGLEAETPPVAADGHALPVFDDPEAFVEAGRGVMADGRYLRIRTRTDVGELKVGNA
ncbi:MAG TPA: TIM-barrel domain-containing protein [Rubricoccaceae bacterium]|nr:TIM-barrel domain-containing protein [Rubricoccaceae bacterium]